MMNPFEDLPDEIICMIRSFLPLKSKIQFAYTCERLKECYDPSENNNEAIIMMAARGETELVKLLLKDKNVNPSTNDDEAFRAAATHGHTEVAELLLKHPKVNPSALDDNAICWAAKNGHTEIVKLLLRDERVDPSTINRKLNISEKV